MRAHEVNMSAAQSANWQKLVTRVTPVLRHLKTLNDELHAAQGASQEVTAKIQRVTHDCEKMSADIICTVAGSGGETVIRTLKVHPDAPPLQTLHPRELRARLRESRADNGILFSGSGGAFEWTFSADAAGGPEEKT